MYACQGAGREIGGEKEPRRDCSSYLRGLREHDLFETRIGRPPAVKMAALITASFKESDEFGGISADSPHLNCDGEQRCPIA